MTATLELAKQLIACPSVTPDDHGCQKILCERLSKLGFDITPYQINKVTNFWARRGQAKPLLCFAGHTDVVPTGNVEVWQSPPFEPTCRDGHLYGRGATDMKSSIAAMITACERFIAQHPTHQGSIAFLITSDEEGLAEDGTQAVLRKLKERQEIPEWCLVGEATSDKRIGDRLRVGRRGSLTGFLKIYGQQSHIAYPNDKNPIHLALPVLQNIVNVKWDHGMPPFPPTTLQFANVRAGVGANNVVPGYLEADFNLRFSPALSPEVIEQKITEILQQSGCEYEIKWRISGKPFYSPADSKWLHIVSSTIEAEMGYSPEHSTGGGTSDGRFFAEYGTHVVELGPLVETAHQVNERVNIEDLEKLSQLYERILERALI